MHTNGSRNIQEYSLHTPLVILHFLKVLHIIPLHIQDDIPKRIAHTQTYDKIKQRDGMIESSTSLKYYQNYQEKKNDSQNSLDMPHQKSSPTYFDHDARQLFYCLREDREKTVDSIFKESTRFVALYIFPKCNTSRCTYQFRSRIVLPSDK